MVAIEVDKAALGRIERQLKGFEYKAPKVLCNSINETAKWAKQELAKEAGKKYTVKKTKLKREMSIKKARYSTQRAVINVAGPVMPVMHFKTSIGKRGTKAQIISSGSLKEIVKTKNGNNRAFVARMPKSGAYRIVQRVYNSDKEHPRYTPENFKYHGQPIKVLSSNSSATMIGSEEHVYGIVEPKIEDKLNERIIYHIKRVLKGKE